MAARPLGNSFLFAFTNDTAHGAFVPKNKGQIIIASSSQTDYAGVGDYARFAKVLAVGPDVKSFKAGDIVLIDKLKWTKGFTHDGIQIWKSDEAQVLGVAKDDSVIYDYVS